MSDESKTTGVRLKLALLALIFFGPLALAWALYYGFPGVVSGERTNAGELLDPARPLPEVSLTALAGASEADAIFREQWTLLTVAPDGCGAACRERLDDTRQVRALLHRRSTRVQRVLVTGDPDDAALTENGHPDLKVLRGGGKLAAFFAEGGERAAEPGAIQLIDPLGNWVLFYPAGVSADAVFKDLKHLLKLSHIG